MKPKAYAYLMALRQIENILHRQDAGELDAMSAEAAVNEIARNVPRLHREWTEER